MCHISGHRLLISPLTKTSCISGRSRELASGAGVTGCALSAAIHFIVGGYRLVIVFLIDCLISLLIGQNCCPPGGPRVLASGAGVT
jgi:hypothetical protein